MVVTGNVSNEKGPPKRAVTVMVEYRALRTPSRSQQSPSGMLLCKLLHAQTPRRAPYTSHKAAGILPTLLPVPPFKEDCVLAPTTPGQFLRLSAGRTVRPLAGVAFGFRKATAALAQPLTRHHLWYIGAMAETSETRLIEASFQR